jgi:hypothetical protein
MKMISAKIFNRIKKEPVTERLRIIEALVQSLKEDINPEYHKITDKKIKTFRVHPISLGEEVQVNRDELYAERS